jgi:hypothetical protein
MAVPPQFEHPASDAGTQVALSTVNGYEFVGINHWSHHTAVTIRPSAAVNAIETKHKCAALGSKGHQKRLMPLNQTRKAIRNRADNERDSADIDRDSDNVAR